MNLFVRFTFFTCLDAKLLNTIITNNIKGDRTLVFKPILFLFLYILVFYSSLYFLEGHSFILSTVSNSMVTIAGIIAVAIILKSYTNQKNQNKPFTLLLLLGCLCYLLGNFYWTYYEYVYVAPPLVGFYDIFMLLAYVSFLWALTYYFKKHKLVLTTTYIYDILIFIVITTTLAWVFIIRPFLMPNFDDYSLLALVTFLGYPIADLSLLFACLMIFLYTSLSKSMLYIIFGFLTNIIANSVYFYFQSMNIPNLSEHLIDPLWASSILLIGFSGLVHFEDNKIKQRINFKKYFQLFIPYTVMIIFLFVVYLSFYDIKDPLLIGVFIAIVLLMIRLFTTIYKNEALNKELNEANDKLKFLAYHDELTKLPNRHYLFEKVKSEIDGNQIPNQHYFYLFFIDLDGFKSVNDTFGHNIGDTLLKQVSSRLKEQMSKEDFLCRFAGDEFIMLVSDKDKASVKTKATAMVESISKPYFIDSHKLLISSSIGISSFEEMDSMLSIIHKADKAMYQIKKNGKNGFEFI